jgi:thiol-disulfide isomerase/thioredoxin
MEPQPGLPMPPEPPAPGDTPPTGMSRRTRAWIGMGAVVAALVLLTMLSAPSVDPNAPPPAADGAASGEPGTTGLAVGQPAPLHFTLKDANGVDVNLESFRGKVILINFWATWCGPCRVEIPDLMELQNQYRDDLVVLGIDVLDEFTRVQAFADELKVNYPLLDGNDREDVEKAFGPMWGLPTTVIVGRDGTVAKRHAGIASKEQFQQYIESAL